VEGIDKLKIIALLRKKKAQVLPVMTAWLYRQLHPMARPLVRSQAIQQPVVSIAVIRDRQTMITITTFRQEANAMRVLAGVDAYMDCHLHHLLSDRFTLPLSAQKALPLSWS
jgi:hypothetical protein